jgi:hypothetical protein
MGNHQGRLTRTRHNEILKHYSIVLQRFRDREAYQEKAIRVLLIERGGKDKLTEFDMRRICTLHRSLMLMRTLREAVVKQQTQLQDSKILSDATKLLSIVNEESSRLMDSIMSTNLAKILDNMRTVCYKQDEAMAAMAEITTVGVDSAEVDKILSCYDDTAHTIEGVVHAHTEPNEVAMVPVTSSSGVVVEKHDSAQAVSHRRVGSVTYQSLASVTEDSH